MLAWGWGSTDQAQHSLFKDFQNLAHSPVQLTQASK